MNKTFVSVAIVAVLAGSLLIGCSQDSETGSVDEGLMANGQKATHARTVETETGGVPFHEPIQYRKKDARPAIVKPEFIPGSASKIAGGTKGIGVEIDGEARFYPLYVLQYHQVVNDTVGDCAIACSY